MKTAAEEARMEVVTRERAGRGAQQERGGRSGCRGMGVLGGDCAGGQGDGRVGEGCGVGAGVAARQGEGADQGDSGDGRDGRVG
jgi:hypothetical protein